METPYTFGERVRALRKAQGRTQKSLAEQLDAQLRAADRPGFDQTYLSKIEKGRMPPPSASAIMALAHALGTPSDDLMALAGKTPLDVGQMLQQMDAARQFYRRAHTMALSDEEWEQLCTVLDSIEQFRAACDAAKAAQRTMKEADRGFLKDRGEHP